MHLQCYMLWARLCIYINVTTFTRFAQNSYLGGLLAFHYACSNTLALSPGIIPSFAVLHTEKLAFQYATLLSWEEGLQGDKAMNLAILCGDFWTFFFLLSVSVP